MRKHFLVTLSNETENLFGIRFICKFFQELSDHEITLLHICRLDSSDMQKTLLQGWENPDEEEQGRLTTRAKKSIDKAKSLLTASKMSVDRVITKTPAERYGKVQDILSEGSQGLYDALVLGRRASYTLQWFFDRPADEIPQTLIKQQSLNIPVWICPEPGDSHKDVLVCVDDSENSYRAVDHVGYILADQEQHRIVLLNVQTLTGSENSFVFERGMNILREHRIAANRVDTISIRGLSVPGTILSEIDRGGYAAAAIGLQGAGGKGSLGGFFSAGGTAAALIGRIEKASLWCCP